MLLIIYCFIVLLHFSILTALEYFGNIKQKLIIKHYLSPYVDKCLYDNLYTFYELLQIYNKKLLQRVLLFS